MTGTKTVSICTPESVQGSHVFCIFGYNKQRGIGAGKFIASSPFSVGGHDWAIRFYPDGFNRDSRDYISVYLELLSKDAEHRGVFNQNNNSRFAPQSAEFMARREFEASAYLRNDHLEVECVVNIMKEAQVFEIKSSPKIKMPPSDITAQLSKLLEANEIPTDVTFGVGGVVFAAHKLVLAVWSPVFNAEFYGPMRKTETPLISIQDMQPNVFKALLHFIYTDSLEILMISGEMIMLRWSNTCSWLLTGMTWRG
ncbi:hypothetical protein VPH35_051934 [Triticum aestivum]